jgi:cell division protein FtsQ
MRPASGGLTRRLPVGFGRASFRIGSRSFAIKRGAGTLATVTLVLASAAIGIVHGGHYDTFRQTYGAPRDIAARALGFGIAAIDVSGTRELTRAEVLAATGLTTADSIAFLDVSQVRARLRAVPMIADATVRKLLPDRLAITIVERDAYALWQHDGVVRIISADGTEIDTLRDERFLKLPHVVGNEANLRVRDFTRLLDQVPEMKPLVRAGILVSGRRWTLKLHNGVDVKLPELQPERALQALAKLEREGKVLDKDIILVDLRLPGRATFRLGEEAAAERHQMLEKKLPKVRGRA